jgi:hypothetical protein
LVHGSRIFYRYHTCSSYRKIASPLYYHKKWFLKCISSSRYYSQWKSYWINPAIYQYS